MKKTFLGAFLIGAMFASCSDEIANNGDPFNGDQAFVKVKISMADTQTRAESGYYVNGTVAENKVQTLGFKFYGADGSFYGYGETIQNPSVTQNGSAGATGNNIEAKVEAVVALKINEGAPKPDKVVAYVNCSNWKQDNEPNLSDISAVTDYLYSEVENTNFAMTSSNFGTDGYATTIGEDKFKESAEAAIAEGNPVDIYVERIAAKVQVTDKTNDDTNVAVELGEYKLQFVMDGWDLGGTNSSSYLVKNLDSSWAGKAPWTGWDAASDFRCFWAKDINYDYAETSLGYTSWKDGSKNDKAIYCHENTFGARDEESNPYKVQPFVYVMGHYIVTKGKGESAETVTGGNLYNYADGIYPESEMIANMQNAAGTIIYEKTTGANNSEIYTGQKLDGKVEIVSYTYEEDGETVTDASRVMLQLKGDAVLTNLYVKDGEEYVSATKENVNEALSKAPVIAYGFKYDATEGGYLAYFPVLIQHLNYSETATDATGAYGIVRNHVYDLAITEIKNLGIGVFNPDVEIIPDEKAKTLYLGAKINILSWKWVSQNVKL